MKEIIIELTGIIGGSTGKIDRLEHTLFQEKEREKLPAGNGIHPPLQLKISGHKKTALKPDKSNKLIESAEDNDKNGKVVLEPSEEIPIREDFKEF